MCTQIPERKPKVFIQSHTGLGWHIKGCGRRDGPGGKGDPGKTGGPGKMDGPGKMGGPGRTGGPSRRAGPERRVGPGDEGPGGCCGKTKNRG